MTRSDAPRYPLHATVPNNFIYFAVEPNVQVNRICREHVLSKQEKSRVYKVAILFVERFVAPVQLLV